MIKNNAKSRKSGGSIATRNPKQQAVARRKPSVEKVKEAALNHEQERIECVAQEDGETGKSQYLGNLVYGGLDGIITTFAVVSGVVGAELSPQIILILGVSNLLADGFSMATGAYLSAKSEQEVYARERHHESVQIVKAPEKEKSALYEAYQQQGYQKEEAKVLTKIVSREPGRWVSTALAEKLLLVPQRRKPAKEGLAAFIAFVIAGAVPLLVYLTDLIFHFDISTTSSFIFAAVLSGLALFALGAAKVFVTERNAWRSGLEMLLIGGAAALVAFGVGMLLKNLVGGPTA